MLADTRLAAIERAAAADAAASERARRELSVTSRRLEEERRELLSSRQEADTAVSESSGLKARLRDLQASLQRAAIERERDAAAAASERALWGGEVASLAEVVSQLEPGGAHGRSGLLRAPAGLAARDAAPRGSPGGSAAGMASGSHSALSQKTAAMLGARSAMQRSSPASGRSGGGGWLGQSPRGMGVASSPLSFSVDGQGNAGGLCAARGYGGSSAGRGMADGWMGAPEPSWTPYRPDPAGVSGASKAAPHAFLGGGASVSAQPHSHFSRAAAELRASGEGWSDFQSDGAAAVPGTTTLGARS